MHWQYTTLPYVLQFVFALAGLFTVAIAYDKKKSAATLLVGAIFLIGFLLPFFSDLIFRHTRPGLSWLGDAVTTDNRIGLTVYVILTVVPWLYFWPTFYRWLTTAPEKRRRK